MLNAREVVARGIVIGRQASGDGSVRVSLYTESYGLVSALAKSAREERSQLRAHLQVATIGTFSLVIGREWRVTGVAHAVNVHFASPRLQHQEVLGRVIALVRRLVVGVDVDPALFVSLEGFMNALPAISSDGLFDAERLIVARVLASLGYIRALPVPETGFSETTLERARASRRALAQAVNEGIRASGL